MANDNLRGTRENMAKFSKTINVPPNLFQIGPTSSGHMDKSFGHQSMIAAHMKSDIQRPGESEECSKFPYHRVIFVRTLR